MKFEEWGNQLEKLFIAIGLTDKESKVYRVLLDGGDLSAGEIINRTHLKRGITYNLLYKLEKDGLVTQTSKGTKTHFRPESPQKLFDLLERKKAQVDYLSANFSQILPKLVSQYKLSVGRPTVRYFEGEQGIRDVFEDIYGPKKDVVYGCVDLEKADEAFPAYILEELIPKRIKNRIMAHSFIADSPQAIEIAKKDKFHLRKSKLVDKKKFPLPAEIDVYEDKIAMLTFIKGEFIGFIIENRDLAETLRSIFKLAFDRREKKSKRSRN